ncbi:MAG: SDR family NAD(P)-dependent oxidoreductase [Sphaerochaeta sp.]|jgi:short-subunit dehydrogenase|nr:SDR family NAD(P)-dependent oxidoreductase [Sphaerochaeta sp.]
METMIAIVTGASSGLGKAYVRNIAAKEKGIQEIWIIARRAERLEELKAEVPICRVMPLDVTSQEDLSRLETTLQTEKPRVHLLINAAGMGKLGDWNVISRADTDQMIDLDCRAAVDVTLIVLPFMQKGDRIMEICSTTAFQPFQHLNVYAASKAFLYRYSRALRVELFPKGISVCAVCPYWIRDTEFIKVAEKAGGKRVIHHYVGASSVKSVANWSYWDAKHGFAVSTPGPICFAHRFFAKFIPSELMMGVWALFRRL